MIEISERFAVAQNAAAKVVTAMKPFEWANSLEWIRRMDDVEKDGQTIAIRCTFWINGDPFDSLDVDVHLAQSHSLFQPHRPWTVLVRYPHSDQVDRWDFDNDGKVPVRVR